MRTTAIVAVSVQPLWRRVLNGASVFFQGKGAVMLTLASKLKRDDGLRGSRASATASDSTRRVSVRDRLLVKGDVRGSWLGALLGEAARC